MQAHAARAVLFNREADMASDSDWVEDVRRWVSTRQAAADVAAPVDEAGSAEAYELGYEAAQPALQARHWPDAPAGGAHLIG